MWKRRSGYDYTGCLAHADITYVETPNGSPGEILRIIGYFQHNTACSESVLVRFPAVPLHAHVVEVALQQLRAGAR